MEWKPEEILREKSKFNNLEQSWDYEECFMKNLCSVADLAYAHQHGSVGIHTQYARYVQQKLCSI